MKFGSIWVYGESSEGVVSTITLEMLTKARELADDVVVVMGGDSEDVAEELGRHGAGTVRATARRGISFPASWRSR